MLAFLFQSEIKSVIPFPSMTVTVHTRLKIIYDKVFVRYLYTMEVLAMPVQSSSFRKSL